MPETRGTGGSFGAALRSALGAVSLGKARPSYTAKSSRAQFRQLERTSAGRRALELAGVGGNRRTRAAWLGGARSPSKANAAAIERAYAAMQRGGIPEWVKRGDMDISGRMKTGSDERDRGQGGNATFLVESDPDNRPYWDAIEEALNRGASDEEIESLGADLVSNAVPPSDFWEFPGSSYEVEIRGV